MVICFECSAETKAHLDRLAVVGKYRTTSELIAVAISNLSVLHASMDQSGAVMIDSHGRSNVDFRVPEQPGPNGNRSSNGWRSTLEALTEPPTVFAELPISPWKPGDVVPVSNWIFGQYNRILPAKFSCRLLANLLHHEPSGIPLSEAQSTISQHASIFGDYLTEIDRRLGLDRDTALSTAFPRSGNDGDKGRMRYANQFVASSNKTGQLSGLLIDFMLINSVSGREPRLLLTEPGWEFAKLSNTILEGQIDKLPLQKLTPEEQHFLIEHVGRNVPVERFAYSSIVHALDVGADTPNELDTELRKYSASDLTDSTSFFSSQRSGAISRMSDLGLIQRVRDGVRVRYEATPAAGRFSRKAN